MGDVLPFPENMEEWERDICPNCEGRFWEIFRSKKTGLEKAHICMGCTFFYLFEEEKDAPDSSAESTEK